MRAPDFLTHLRTDDRGRPVPYINRWGPERVEHLSIRHDPLVGMPGIFLDDAGETEPDFFHQNMGRQRECMARGLCQVCGRPVPWSQRHLVLSSMSVDSIDLHGQAATVVTEPWLDARCAAFALRVCPGLIRRSSAQDLQLLRIGYQSRVALVVSRGWVDGPLEQRSKREQPAMWVKAMVVGVQIAEPA